MTETGTTAATGRGPPRGVTVPAPVQPDSLPGRAAAAFEVRRAKRAAVPARWHALQLEAYAAGASDRPPDPAPPPTRAADEADAADLRALGWLALGAPGTPGGPVRWDDPRLGPLWPDGPPAWHAELEARCRDLEQRLRSSPSAGEDDLTDDVLSQLADRAWLDDEREAGKLDRYRGRYVVAANRVILAHDRNLLKAREKARKKADQAGVPAGRLAYYFVTSD